MSKIAFTTLHKTADSSLSPHFGKAKWLFIRDLSTGTSEFIPNKELTGRALIRVLKEHHCDEVVFAAIGPGALKMLKQSGLAGWFAPLKVPVSALWPMLTAGQLRLARKPNPGPGHWSHASSAQASSAA